MKRSHENVLNKHEATANTKRTRKVVAGLALVSTLAGGAACSPNGNAVKATHHSDKTEQTTANNRDVTTTNQNQSPETTQNNGNFIQSFPNQETIASDGKPTKVFTDDQGNYSVKDVVLSHMKDENIWLVTGDEDALANFTPRPEDASKYDMPNSWHSEHSNREKFLKQTGYQEGEHIPANTYYTNVDLDSVDYEPMVGVAIMTAEYVTIAKSGRVDVQRYELVFGTIDTIPASNSSDKQFAYTNITSAAQVSSTDQ